MKTYTLKSECIEIKPSSVWVTVELGDHEAGAVKIGHTLESSKSGPAIGPNSRYGWPVMNGSVWIRAAQGTGVTVTVQEWSSWFHKPADVIRPVIGTTAKGRKSPQMIQPNAAPVQIDSPSTGEFAATVMLDPQAGGYARVGSNSTLGLWALPGEPLHLPQWNGTLWATYHGDDKPAEIVVLKHENAFMWDY